MRPRVTVGIPFYNAQDTLADAIRSVFAQTLTDWELVLVDDGSTDGSLKIALSVDDPRVRVVSDGRNLKLAARLNQIAQLAKGKYLARMDADDLMHPDRLAVQCEFLDTHPRVDLVDTAGAYILDNFGNPIAKRYSPQLVVSPWRVFARSLLHHAMLMGRTEWFRQNPYNPAYYQSEDYALWCRTFSHSQFARLPGYYYYQRDFRSFTLDNYVRRCRVILQVLWTEGVKHLGFLPCCFLSVIPLLKTACYGVAFPLGLHQRLGFIARRNIPLTPDEIEQVTAELKKIRSFNLPTRPDIPLNC